MNVNDIAHKTIVLKLNRSWKPLHVAVVWKTICDMINGVVQGINIEYAMNNEGEPDFEQPILQQPVNWEKWITLPVRPWDLSIHSSHREYRVPTVVVASNFAKLPKKEWKGKPTKEGVLQRDMCIDPYTGLVLEWEEATLDHVTPLSRGGTDTYDNVVCTTKEINNAKGNKLNEEAGLTMLFQPSHPKPTLTGHTIRKIRHHDWKFFLDHLKNL